MDFTRRSNATELMDTETVEAGDFERCLADLSVVNRLTLAKRPTLAWLDRAASQLPRGSKISILDVGFGHGDMLRAIWHWGGRRGLQVDLLGIDINPMSAYVAKRATPAHMKIDFRTGDVFALTADQRFDFIVCSLLAHHLSDAQIIAFLRWMEHQSDRGWFINDLHRHPVPYHAFRMLAALAGWHRFVRHDGPVSIARSFRRDDWCRSLAEAGIDADLSWSMPFRLCVGRIKSVPPLENRRAAR